jgi:hypothetical protein
MSRPKKTEEVQETRQEMPQEAKTETPQEPSPMTKLLDKYKETLVASQRDIETVPYNMRQGAAIGIQSAKDSLVSLKSTILEATVPRRLIGCFVTGDEQKIKEISEFLSSNEGIVATSNAWFTPMVEDMWLNQSPDHLFNLSQFGLMRDYLRDTAFKAGVVSMQSPSYESVVCHTKEELLAHAKRSVNNAVGNYFSVTELKSQILNQVIERSIDAKKVPVLVLGCDDHEQSDFSTLFSRTTSRVIDSNFEVSAQTVTELFKSI